MNKLLLNIKNFFIKIKSFFISTKKNEQNLFVPSVTLNGTLALSENIEPSALSENELIFIEKQQNPKGPKVFKAEKKYNQPHDYEKVKFIEKKDLVEPKLKSQEVFVPKTKERKRKKKNNKQIQTEQK